MYIQLSDTCIPNLCHLSWVCVDTFDVVEGYADQQVVSIDEVEEEYRRVLCAIEEWDHVCVEGIDNHGYAH